MPISSARRGGERKVTRRRIRRTPPAHEGEMPRRRGSNASAVHQRMERTDREAEVRVGGDAGMIERVTPVAAPQRRYGRGVRDEPEAAVTAADGLVEGLLAEGGQPGARAQRDPGRRDGCTERVPRDRIQAAPRIGGQEQPRPPREFAHVTHWGPRSPSWFRRPDAAGRADSDGDCDEPRDPYGPGGQPQPVNADYRPLGLPGDEIGVFGTSRRARTICGS
jgi:hypothetical protein